MYDVHQQSSVFGPPIVSEVAFATASTMAFHVGATT
jgi:hypothetical protein